MSLRRLANLIGRSHGYLFRIEAEQQKPAEVTIRRIADALDVPIGAITREIP